jgi:hypothetical protein
MTVIATAPALNDVAPLVSLPVTDVDVPTETGAVKVNVKLVPPSAPVGAPDRLVPPTSVADVKSDAKLAVSAVTVHVTASELRTICATASAP